MLRTLEPTMKSMNDAACEIKSQALLDEMQGMIGLFRSVATSG